MKAKLIEVEHNISFRANIFNKPCLRILISHALSIIGVYFTTNLSTQGMKQVQYIHMRTFLKIAILHKINIILRGVQMGKKKKS